MREMIDTRGRLMTPQFLSKPISVPSIHLRTTQNVEIFLPELSKNSLLCISGSALGYESLSAIIAKIQMKGQPIISVHLLNGHLKHFFLKTLTIHNLRRSCRDGELNIVLKGPMEEFSQLGVENSYGGYAFLVNNSGQIYWKCSGGLNQSELEQI